MKIAILTGAGVSAESGLGTFRDKDGLWTKHDLEEVATPQGFQRNPKLVHDFYNARRKNAAEARTNAVQVVSSKTKQTRCKREQALQANGTRTKPTGAKRDSNPVPTKILATQEA